jgi:3-isopropylmalate dehydrogenase
VANHIVLLPGDGIGPEIMAAARELLDAVGGFELDERLVGGASIDAHGTALTGEVLEACRGAEAILLAAVGGPKWDTTDPDAPRPEQGLLGLRKELGLFANIRPVRPSPALHEASPHKPDPQGGTDQQVVRARTGGK